MSGVHKKLGNAFARAFYGALAANPDTCAMFYGEGSFLTRSVGDSHTEFVGATKIAEFLKSESCAPIRTAIAHITTQACRDLVVVQVAGFQTHGEEQHRFVETFILSPIEKGTRYFVLNDAFVSFDEDFTSIVSRPAAPLKETAAAPAPQADSGAAIEAQAEVPVESLPVAAEAPEEAQVEQQEPEEAQAEPEQEEAADVAAVVIEQKPEETPVDVAVQIEASVPVDMPQAEPEVAPVAVPEAPAPAPVAPAAPVVPTPAPVAAPQPPRSYANVAGSGTMPQPRFANQYRRQPLALCEELADGPHQEKLTALFAECGSVASVEILADRGYAFVNYESPEGVTMALLRQWTLDDQLLNVEARRPPRTDMRRPFRPFSPRYQAPGQQVPMGGLPPQAQPQGLPQGQRYGGRPFRGPRMNRPRRRPPPRAPPRARPSEEPPALTTGTPVARLALMPPCRPPAPAAPFFPRALGP
ncbi:hypothetical protein PAPYR_1340 [Paratrimastix pyriformis]|uniref:Nuclear transport factor 2 n=1 Tax=Paratrimastix pyriformis TaxID=342808 RepID=A0ABQ8UTJ8_9EUKA|nr:hypothetical protein PAPYR_1340 [Paratrimastix pyriformis]